MLHAADPAAADWPWPVMGSGFAGTTAPSAADVERDVVAATVATVAAARGQDGRTRAHFRDRSPGHTRTRPTARL